MKTKLFNLLLGIVVISMSSCSQTAGSETPKKQHYVVEITNVKTNPFIEAHQQDSAMLDTAYYIGMQNYRNEQEVIEALKDAGYVDVKRDKKIFHYHFEVRKECSVAKQYIYIETTELAGQDIVFYVSNHHIPFDRTRKMFIKV